MLLRQTQTLHVFHIYPGSRVVGAFQTQKQSDNVAILFYPVLSCPVLFCSASLASFFEEPEAKGVLQKGCVCANYLEPRVSVASYLQPRLEIFVLPYL